jgi:hypothetical protein
LISGWCIKYPDWWFHVFSQSLWPNARVVHQLGQEPTLPNPFQIIIHLSCIHSFLCSLAAESIIKYSTNKFSSLCDSVGT